MTRDLEEAGVGPETLLAAPWAETLATAIANRLNGEGRPPQRAEALAAYRRLRHLAEGSASPRLARALADGAHSLGVHLADDPGAADEELGGVAADLAGAGAVFTDSPEVDKFLASFVFASLPSLAERSLEEPLRALILLLPAAARRSGGDLGVAQCLTNGIVDASCRAIVIGGEGPPMAGPRVLTALRLWEDVALRDALVATLREVQRSHPEEGKLHRSIRAFESHTQLVV